MRRRVLVIPLVFALGVGGVLALGNGLPAGGQTVPVATSSAIPGASASPQADVATSPAVAAPSLPAAIASLPPELAPPSPLLIEPSTAPLAVPSPSASAPSVTPGGVAAVDMAHLDQVLGKARAKDGVPGMAATIIWPDGSSWTGVAGYADVAHKRKVDPSTIFAAASVSKTFTAALVLSLVEDGYLGFDQRVQDLLDGIPTKKVPRSVTVRMLLDHTSGLADYYLQPKANTALLGDRDRVWTPAMALRFVDVPYFKPGTEWKYSNTNYLLLGMIAEAITGQSLGEAIHERLIDPLGLDDTTIQGYEPPAGTPTNAYRFNNSSPTAKPVLLDDGTDVIPFTSVVTASGGAGSVASTSGDLARWARALYGGQVLRPATLAEMERAVADTKPYKPSVAYGLGVQKVKVAGHPAYGHSGRFIGARSLMRYLPDVGLAVAVVANTNRTDLSKVLGSLVKVALGHRSPSASPGPSAASAMPSSAVPTD